MLHVHVHCLSSICEQKIAGPKNFFITSYRPKVEPKRDIAIFLEETWPQEIFRLKITIVCNAILHGQLLTCID